MKKNLMNIVISVFLIMFASSTWAHSDEHLSSVKAPHNGQLRMAGPYHFELVAKDGELRLYVTDHMDHEIITKGASGKANIIDKNGKKLSVALVPVFGNLMKGVGEFVIDPDTVVSVFVVMSGAETQAARFTPLAEKASAATKEGGELQHEHEHEHEHEQQVPAEQNASSEAGEHHSH